ncbi:MAG: hypothetical protein ACRYFX_13850 [Janthinobacterium lividum]
MQTTSTNSQAFAQAIEVHTHARNGHIEFELPPGYPELANASLVLLITPQPTGSTPVGHTDWDKLAAAYAAFEGHDPYPTITDAVEWQRQLRADDERELIR